MAAALLVRWGLDPWLGDGYPVVLIIGAVAIGALFAHTAAVIVVGAVGYVAANFLFLTPRGALSLADPAQVAGLVAYAFTAGCLILLGGAARRYQRELRNEKDLLAVTLAGIGDGVITCDAKGAITMLNKVAESLTGWTSADAAGQPIEQVFRIVHESTRDPTDNPVFRAIREGTIVGLANHTVLLARDGREIPIDDSAAPIVHEGAVVGAVLVFRDITERKQAFDALQAAGRNKSDFLAVLGHELRSPLSAVLHAAHVMHERPQDLPTVVQASRIVQRQARHLARLVEDLLDLSRIEQNNIRLRFERVRLDEVVQQAAEASASALQSGGHRLQVELPDPPVELEADGARLAQVLGNLLTNAARYSPEPGEIHLAGKVNGSELRIAVTDHGMGIRPEDLEKLFHLFSRLEPGPDRKSGLGVGLALSRSLVELHGGRIEAKSDGHGKGSCFTVTLPLARA